MFFNAGHIYPVKESELVNSELVLTKMSRKFPSKIPVPVNKPDGLSETTENPDVNYKPNTVVQETALAEGSSTIYRNVVRIGHKDNAVYRKRNGFICTKNSNVKERVEPLVRAHKVSGKNCRKNYGNVKSKVDTGVRTSSTLKTTVSISGNKRDGAPVNHQNVKSFNKMSSVKSKVSGGTTDIVCRIPVLNVLKRQQNLPPLSKKVDKAQSINSTEQHVSTEESKVVQGSEQHSSIIIREPEIVQDRINNNLPGIPTTLNVSSTAVSDVPTSKSQKLKTTGLRKLPSLKTCASIPSNKRGGARVSNQIVNSLNEGSFGIGEISGSSADTGRKISVQKITPRKNVPTPVKRLQKTKNIALYRHNVIAVGKKLDQGSGRSSSIRKWESSGHLHELDNTNLLDTTTSINTEAVVNVSTSEGQSNKETETSENAEFCSEANCVPITAEEDDSVLQPSGDIVAKRTETPSVQNMDFSTPVFNRFHSILKRKTSEDEQEVDNKKQPDATTTRGESTETVAGVEITSSLKKKGVTFGYVEYFSEAHGVTIIAGKEKPLSQDFTAIVAKKVAAPSVEDMDLITSISSFASLKSSCNINNRVWKKSAPYILRKRNTTWKRECRTHIPEKHLQVCVDRETKDVLKEKPFERTLNDIYMTVYMKWYAFQQIASRVNFEVFEIKTMAKATIQTVIRNGVLTTLTHETNKFLCVKNVHRDDAFWNVSAIEVYRNKLYYTSANNVWSLSLVDAGLPVMEYENSQPLQSFSVFGEKMHCLTEDPLVLDICSLKQSKQKLQFQVGPSYKCSQRKTFKICDKGVIVGMYLEAQTPYNQIFEVFMLRGKEIRSVYRQNVAELFTSNISCFYVDGSTFLLGLEFGVVMLYHVTSWDTFNLTNYVKVFKGFDGGIRSIHVEEGEFQRIFVIGTDLKMYDIFGAVCY